MTDFEQLFHSEEMRQFIEAATKGHVRRRGAFSLALRASLAKSYHFNVVIRQKRFKSEATPFFLVPSLRGICEDLIVLNFVKQMPPTDRDELIWSMAQYTVAAKIRSQAEFFREARPFQRVINPDPFDVDMWEERARCVWRRHGWPNLRRGLMPQIRQIAERQHLGVLPALYDYLYRMTSGMVHFDVHVLFRSGWGPINKRGSKLEYIQFSPENFASYYHSFARVYGAYTFLLYFEFFAGFLRPGPTIRPELSNARLSLRAMPRWPEMVTWEEMNLTPRRSDFLSRFATLVHARDQADRLITNG